MRPSFGKRTPSFLLLLVIVLLGTFACTREVIPPIRIGTNVWSGYEPLYLARSIGAYKEEEVRLLEFSTASEVIRQFRNGSIDAAALTLDEALLLAHDGFDLSVVLVLDTSNGGDVILARKELKNFSEIKGLKVGVEGSALGAYFLGRALEINGMTTKDVIILQRNITEHEEAFLKGEVDAVVTFQPVKTRLLAQGASVLFDSSQIPNEIIDVLVVRKSFLAKRPERVTALLKGWFKTTDFIKSDLKEATEKMAAREHISPEEFALALDDLSVPDYEGNLLMLSGNKPKLNEVVSMLVASMLKNRLLKKHVDGLSIIDAAPLQRLKMQ